MQSGTSTWVHRNTLWKNTWAEITLKIFYTGYHNEFIEDFTKDLDSFLYRIFFRMVNKTILFIHLIRSCSLFIVSQYLCFILYVKNISIFLLIIFLSSAYLFDISIYFIQNSLWNRPLKYHSLPPKIFERIA